MTLLATPEQREKIKMYLALMEEARTRIEVINRIYHNEERFPAQMVREICFLQFRFLCEIVALGCLVVHDGVKKTKRLQATYKAGSIISAMEAQKPHFYPVPIEIKREGGRLDFRAKPDRPHLTKKDVGKLWSHAGNVVHRGSFTKLGKPEDMVRSLKPIQSTRNKFPDIFEWREKITGLLNCHWITLVENKRGLQVDLLTETGRSKGTILDFDISDSLSPGALDVEWFQFQSDR